MQSVIEAGLIAPLVNLLQNAEFDIKKEAAWAISNATSGGTHEQIKYVNFYFQFFFTQLHNGDVGTWGFMLLTCCMSFKVLGEPGLHQASL